MYVKYAPNTSDARGLMEYLDKENTLVNNQLEKIQEGSGGVYKNKCIEYLTKEDRFHEKEFFFNDKSKTIEASEASFKIGNNVKGLKKNETHFYMMTLSPSRAELSHLNELAKLQAEELGKKGEEVIIDKCLRDLLKQYTCDAMDKYAQNFGRDGINSAEDLVWFAKVEKDRYWKHDDKDVIKNKQLLRKIERLEKIEQLNKHIPQKDSGVKFWDKVGMKHFLEAEAPTDLLTSYKQQLVMNQGIPVYSGMPKSGLNHHVHVVISRKDATQKMSLSPLSKQKTSENHKINGRECKVGFNRDDFAQTLETKFNEKFDYFRWYADTYESAKGRQKIKKEKDPELNRELRKTYMRRERGWNEELLDRKYPNRVLYRETRLERRQKKLIWLTNRCKYANYYPKRMVNSASKGVAKGLLRSAGVAIPGLSGALIFSKLALKAGRTMNDIAQEK